MVARDAMTELRRLYGREALYGTRNGVSGCRAATAVVRPVGAAETSSQSVGAIMTGRGSDGGINLSRKG